MLDGANFCFINDLERVWTLPISRNVSKNKALRDGIVVII
jgi:hypothetical protein